MGKNLKRKTEVAPLVVVLDDMQRFDKLSWDFTIKVMEAIPTSIYLIGIIRNEESFSIEQSLQISDSVLDLQNTPEVLEIDLKGKDSVLMLMSKILELDPEDIAPTLAQVVINKTNCSPLAVIHFVNNILTEGFIDKKYDDEEDKTKTMMKTNDYIDITPLQPAGKLQSQ